MKTTLLLLAALVISLCRAQEITHSHSIYHAFVENKGQWPEPVLFKSHLDGGNLWVQQRKFVFHLTDYSAMQKAHVGALEKGDHAGFRQTVVHLNFAGSQEVRQIEKTGATRQYYNYFTGNDAHKWASEVRGYSEAVMHDLYPGIDLKLIEDETNLKYEFHVRPQSDPKQIVLSFAGHDKLSIDGAGNLVVKTPVGQIIEKKPYCYQIRNGRIVEVDGAFEIEGHEVRFRLGKFDPRVTLVIDPVLVFATYSGSPTDNFGMTATYGYDGTAYSGGTVFGNAYPTPDNAAYDVNSNFTVANNPEYGITDVFISKYSPDGTTMLWTSYIGGGDGQDGTETVHSMICDKQNNLYFFGATSSLDFPIVNGYQATHSGGEDSLDLYYNGIHFKEHGTDLYVAKLSSNGHNLMASTFMGGSGNDGINYRENMPYTYFIVGPDTLASGTYYNVNHYDSLTINYGDQFRGEVMLDSAGNCLVASCTRSSDFPVSNAIQGTNNGGLDGVIFKLSNDLSSLAWSTYFGGSKDDACYSIKVDSTYNLVFAGGTASSDLAQTAGGYQPTYNGGKTDGFVGKLAPNGLTLQQVSYIGTSNWDQAFFVEIDRNDNVFVLGLSRGGTFPVFNSTYVNPNSAQFVIKLDPTLSTNLNSTVFGNGNSQFNISPAAFLVDVCGNIYVSGWGSNILPGVPGLNGMPTTSDAEQANAGDGHNFYLFVLDRTFSNMLYGTYLGGGQAEEHVDGGTSRFDKNGVVYQSVCGGCGGFSDFPTYPNPGAWSNFNLSSNCNNIVFKFDFELIPEAEFTASETEGCVDFTVTLDNFSTLSDSYLWDFGNGDTSTVDFEPTVTFDTPGTYDIQLFVTDSICLLTDSALITISVYDSIQLTADPDIFLCTPQNLTIGANSFGTASGFVWSSNVNFSDTLNANPMDSVISVSPDESVTYYVQAYNNGCSRIDSVQVSFVSSSISVSAGDSICLGESTVLSVQNSNPQINFSYSWTPASSIEGPTNGTQVTVSPTASGYFYVTADDGNGCVVSDSIYVAVSNISDATISATASDSLVASGSSVTLTAHPSGYSYSWVPAGSVSSPHSQQTTATVNETTTYVVFISDGICSKSASVLVKSLEYVCEEPYLFVPSGFSPNGDGENDVLFVRGKIIKEMTFRVFDRWGEMVFESTDPNIGWDGTFRGKMMDPDTYDYYLQVICIDDQESIIKGNVTLLR